MVQGLSMYTCNNSVLTLHLVKLFLVKRLYKSVYISLTETNICLACPCVCVCVRACVRVCDIITHRIRHYGDMKVGLWSTSPSWYDPKSLMKTIIFAQNFHTPVMI